MMRQKEIDLLYQYLWNRFTYLEQDVQQLQQNVRYRHIDAVDCLELCLALERLNAFKQFSADVRGIVPAGSGGRWIERQKRHKRNG